MTQPIKLPTTSLTTYEPRLSTLQQRADRHVLRVRLLSGSERPSRRKFEYIQSSHSSLCAAVAAFKAIIPRGEGPTSARHRHKPIVTTPQSALTEGLSRLDATIATLAKNIGVLGRELAIRNGLQIIACQAMPASFSSLPPSSRAPCAVSLKIKASQLTAELDIAVTSNVGINTASLKRHVSHIQAGLLQYADDLENLDKIDAELARLEKHYEERSHMPYSKLRNITQYVVALKNHYPPLLIRLKNMLAAEDAEIESVMKWKVFDEARLNQDIRNAKDRLKEINDATRQCKLGMILERKAGKREIEVLIKTHAAQMQATTTPQDESDFLLQIAEKERKAEQDFKAREAALQLEADAAKSKCQAIIIKTEKYLSKLKKEIKHQLNELFAQQVEIADELSNKKTEYFSRLNIHTEMLRKYEAELTALLAEHALARGSAQGRYAAIGHRLKNYEAQTQVDLARLDYPAPVAVTAAPPATSSLSTSSAPPKSCILPPI